MSGDISFALGGGGGNCLPQQGFEDTLFHGIDIDESGLQPVAESHEGINLSHDTVLFDWAPCI